MTRRRRIVFHVDMDAFFASIEQRDNPDFRGKPVIVGARPGTRGVVSAASYEARTFGVHSAMPINQAYARCPHGIFVRPRMHAYSSDSRTLMSILYEFSPAIEPVSVDEAFVDMTGTSKRWPRPRDAAAAIAARIHERLSITASIGVAPNKFLAKLASDFEKPRGITVTPFDPDHIGAWLAPMPVSRIWGVGARTQEALGAWGVHTIGDLQRLPRDELVRRFGKGGESLWGLCRGIDSRPVGGGEQVKSISREHTFSADSADTRQWHATLLSLARDVAQRTRRKGLKGRTVCLSYRTPDFQRHSRQVRLHEPTDLARRIYREARQLLDRETVRIRSLRLLGVGMTHFDEPLQTSLFADGTKEEKAWRASEAAMDHISAKYGKKAIFLAGERQRDGHDRH